MTDKAKAAIEYARDVLTQHEDGLITLDEAVRMLGVYAQNHDLANHPTPDYDAGLSSNYEPPDQH